MHARARRQSNTRRTKLKGGVRLCAAVLGSKKNHIHGGRSPPTSCISCSHFRRAASESRFLSWWTRRRLVLCSSCRYHRKRYR